MVIIKMIATALSGDRIVTDKVLKFVTIKGVKKVTSLVYSLRKNLLVSVCRKYTPGFIISHF